MLRSERARTSRSQSSGKAAPPVKQPSKKPAKPAAASSPPESGPIDAQQARRIRNGRDGIDARIDLHGMRQSEAHSALRVFLHRSVAKGHRIVLVITGKGGTRRGDGDDAFGTFVHEGPPDRGVLRRNVPLWLSEPDLRAIVVGHMPAHIRHGGDGAFYVQLRRNRRS
jgi:DNA-nicking Smr family endonuclease